MANDPRSYREVMAITIQNLRPEIEVWASEPADLEQEIVRLDPDLVVCSQTPVMAHSSLPTCIVMYPDGENRAEIVTAGQCVNIPGVEFADLLTIIDGTMLLCREPVRSEASYSGRRAVGSTPQP